MLLTKEIIIFLFFKRAEKSSFRISFSKNMNNSSIDEDAIRKLKITLSNRLFQLARAYLTESNMNPEKDKWKF